MNGYKEDLGKAVNRLVNLFKWLDKIGIEDGDIEKLTEYTLFSQSSNDKRNYNDYLQLRHWFLDDYGSDEFCFLAGQDIYDLVFNMYTHGYRVSFDKLENK